MLYQLSYQAPSEQGGEEEGIQVLYRCDYTCFKHAYYFILTIAAYLIDTELIFLFPHTADNDTQEQVMPGRVAHEDSNISSIFPLHLTTLNFQKNLCHLKLLGSLSTEMELKHLLDRIAAMKAMIQFCRNPLSPG